MIVQELYGGKVAGREFWHHLRRCMKHLVFESCLDDTNAWMHAFTRIDVTKYNEYVILYFDDLLVISDKAKDILRKDIGLYFELK